MAKRSPAIFALSTLGDPTRRFIFECLADRPLNVGQITERVEVTQSAVSQHLRVMKEAGLVTEEAQGTRRVYRIDSRGISEMRGWLDSLWGRGLEAFRDYADEKVKSGKPK